MPGTGGQGEGHAGGADAVPLTDSASTMHGAWLEEPCGACTRSFFHFLGDVSAELGGGRRGGLCINVGSQAHQGFHWVMSGLRAEPTTEPSAELDRILDLPLD